MKGAHPRSRGENADCMSSMVAPFGSSPLTRGKRQTSRNGSLISGLIPAHAGKTCLAGLVGAHAEAHPRSRGENFQAELDMIQERGSSPLTRGKPDRTARPGQVLGLIPAHAGKTR